MNVIDRFWFGVEKSNTCWVWRLGKISTGYGAMNEGGKQYLAHRISWMIHKGPLPARAFVLHHCDNRACVNPHHLFLGDAKANSMDCASKGRLYLQNSDRRGSKHSQAKLTEEDVFEIFRMASEGLGPQEISRRFNLTRGAVGNILKRRSWKHINPVLN